ncbi:zinc ribbon domain-containing protein [Streptomyces sp. NPDC047860]|uniref:double zinc ribbon domain-containing protein n=1 Tax=Streptomyces sp. NPDC047860 TaxID=3155743 RepID=UPI0033DC993B
MKQHASPSSGRECPYCKEEVKPDATKCKHCGSFLLPEEPGHGGICPYCKEEIKPDATKCKHCGSQVSGHSLRTGKGSPCERHWPKPRPGSPLHRLPKRNPRTASRVSPYGVEVGPATILGNCRTETFSNCEYGTMICTDVEHCDGWVETENGYEYVGQQTWTWPSYPCGSCRWDIF